MIDILHFFFFSLFPENFIHWFEVARLWNWGLLFFSFFQTFLKKGKCWRKSLSITPFNLVINNWFYNLGTRRRCSWLFGDLGREAMSSLNVLQCIVNHMLKTFLKTWFDFQSTLSKLSITNSTNLSKQVHSNNRKLITVENKL